MTRPQDLYADEVNRLVRVAWANPERYNAAYPDDPIYATRSMPFFIADHGWYVNGVKTDDPYPDIPEDYTVPLYPPEWSLPLAEISVDNDVPLAIVQPALRLFAKPQPQPYSGPLELDGTPVKIQPGSRWPVGYRREKDTWSIIQQAFWFTLALFGVPWFLGSPGAEGWAYLILLVLLINFSWLEWTSRCEDRLKVQRVAIAYNAFLAAWAVHQHEEAQQREEARVIRGEYESQQRREDQAKFEAQQAENRRLEELASQRWINQRDHGGSWL